MEQIRHSSTIPHEGEATFLDLCFFFALPFKSTSFYIFKKLNFEIEFDNLHNNLLWVNMLRTVLLGLNTISPESKHDTREEEKKNITRNRKMVFVLIISQIDIE